jgi:hypothetical protein
MKRFASRGLTRATAALLAVVLLATSTPGAWAASHREAPLIALDPAADITDVYFFRSWNDSSKIVLIMNVIPSQVPSSGPNYFFFDPAVRYAFHLDLNGDGNANDLNIEITFTTELRAPFNDLPIPQAGVNGVTGLPPAVTALEGTGSEGLGLRQRYTIRATNAAGQTVASITTDQTGKTLFAVPSNVGSRTMPSYEALAAQGVYNLGSGIRVFAGQRAESFYIDLGATFDTLNLRRNPPVLTDAEDANDAVNPFGQNDFNGLNVNTIAVEFPVSLLGTVSPILGMHASTSRANALGQFRQVARMGNPLVNELIIGTGQKDFWNATDPVQESLFVDFYRTPRLASILQAAFGITIPATPRTDLVSVLLQYPSGGTQSDLLRLDTRVLPAMPADQKRLTVLAHNAAGTATPDAAGWPNGRRPNDDVTDIALRVVAGVLNSCCSGFPNNRIGDGVNFVQLRSGTTGVTANGIAINFPFLATPTPGRN